MINQKEFCSYLQKILDDNTVISDVAFKVRTLDLPFFDTMAKKIDDTNDPQITLLPVMVEQTPEGGYDPIPDLGLWDGTLSVSLLFPLADLESMELLYDYIASKLSGRYEYIGDISGNCVMAVGQRTFGQMQLLDVGQFSQINQQIMAYYGKECRVTREWLSMTFQVDFAGSNPTDDEGRVIYGNEIRRALTITYADDDDGTVSLTEELKLVDASSANSIMPFSQQYIYGYETTSIASCSAKGASVTCYVRNNKFWQKLLECNNYGEIENLLSVSYYEGTEINLEEVPLFYKDVIITDIGLSGGYGEPLTCSISLAPKGKVLKL